MTTMASQTKTILLYMVALLSLYPSTARIFDRFLDTDECYLERTNSFEPCNPDSFPTCADNELICYNRRPHRNSFHDDIRQPKFYIDYRSVYCYPDKWNGCSSCTPGRMCLSEQRCILQDADYPCEQWI